MNAKCRFKDVMDAWQFTLDEPIPEWLAKECHVNSTGELAFAHGWRTIPPGWWVVDTNLSLIEEPGIRIVSPEEFVSMFELLPPAPP